MDLQELIIIRIRKLMINKKISQTKMGELTGMGRVTINKILAGGRDIKLNDLDRIARALGRSPASLLK